MSPEISLSSGDNEDRLKIDQIVLFLYVWNYALFHMWPSMSEDCSFNGKTQFWKQNSTIQLLGWIKFFGLNMAYLIGWRLSYSALILDWIPEEPEGEKKRKDFFFFYLFNKPEYRRPIQSFSPGFIISFAHSPIVFFFWVMNWLRGILP